MRGDRVEIVIDAGDSARTYWIAATKAGRRVEVTTGRSVIEVVELTRTGASVRTARFMASRVLALVEHPATERTDEDRAEQQVTDRVRALEDRPRPRPEW